VDPELVVKISEGRTSNEGNIYSSHEGLLLGYEESATKLTNNSRYYNLSTHLLWLGERTRQLDGGHVEYFSGISNPIAAKVGPSTNGATLKALVERLNPNNQEGKLVIICRMGIKAVEKVLPELIETKKKNGLNFIWSVDPMHGNTYSTASGIKTRKTQDILQEMTTFASIMH
jgi:3-deoxy-7-phosphoheptulonate synthase